MIYETYTVGGVLCHHGVKGMKWNESKRRNKIGKNNRRRKLIGDVIKAALKKSPEILYAMYKNSSPAYYSKASLESRKDAIDKYKKAITENDDLMNRPLYRRSGK